MFVFDFGLKGGKLAMNHKHTCRDTELQWLTGNDERKVCSAFKKQHFPKWVQHRIQIDCEKGIP